MIAVRMVQAAVHQIVEMVAMRHPFMPAVWTVLVGAGDFRRALHGICGVDRDDMLVDVIFMHVVEMAVVKVVDMAIMANSRVPAARAMLVGMIGMMLVGAGRHLVSFLLLVESDRNFFIAVVPSTQKGQHPFPEPEQSSSPRFPRFD